jgi:lipopolysaccharide export system protein LptA
MIDRMIIAVLALCVATEAVAATAKAPVPFAGNKGTPIDVTSDQLDVQQENNIAIFTGHVVAIQGNMRLTSQKMVVHYKQREQGDAGKPKKSGDDAISQSSIEKIDVEGDVFLTTPTQTASGATGVYDLDQHTITLNTGVVLTKDKNTLKGDHLLYHVDTGKSTLTSDSSPQQTGGKGKRVRALFIPDKNDKVPGQISPEQKPEQKK